MKYAITEYAGSIVANGDATTSATEHLKHRLYFWQTSCDVLRAKLDKAQVTP